jgi:hypothetical protein
MNRAGLIVVIIALLLAVVTAWSPAEARGTQQGTIAVAGLIDASVKSAPILGESARDPAYLQKLLANRDVHTIELGDLMTGDQADMLSALLNGSDVLSENLLLTQAAVRDGGPLGQLLAAHDIPADRVIAVDLTVDTAAPVTVYLFKRF